MNSTRNGFTLIELLAVIIIISIIALIAVPLILNIIEESRKGAFQNSAYGLINAAENEYLISQLRNVTEDLVYIYEDGKIVDGEDLNYRGTPPLGGTIIVKEDGRIGIAIHDGKWCAVKDYDYDKVKVNKYEEDQCLIKETFNFAFNREITEHIYDVNYIKIIDYKLPDGIYKKGDSIEGYFVVEGVQSGQYEILTELIHSSNQEESIYTEFSIEANEIKTINISYTIPNDFELGYYSLLMALYPSVSNGWVAEYYAFNSIYLVSSEWYYFNDNNLHEVTNSNIGIGSLSPDNIYYFDDNLIPNGEKNGIAVVINRTGTPDKITGQVRTSFPVSYGSYEASIIVPEQHGLLNGFFLYGYDENDPEINYEIDIEILFYEGRWQLWTTVFNPTHKDYSLGIYLDDYDPSINYNHEGEPYAEPGVIYQKQIDLNFDPTLGYNSYRIDFYPKYISFKVNDREVSRWDNEFDYGDMYLYTGTFFPHWLEQEKIEQVGESGGWYEEMNIQWMRKAYFEY